MPPFTLTMANDLDRLGIQIEAEGKKADDALSNLEKSLMGIADLLKGLKVDGHISKDLSSIAASTREIASAMRGLSGAGFEKVSSSAKSATAAMEKTAQAVKRVTDSAKDVKGVNFQLVPDSEIGRLLQLKQNYQAIIKDMTSGKIAPDDSLFRDAVAGLAQANAAIKEYKANVSAVVPEMETVKAATQDVGTALMVIQRQPNFTLIGDGGANEFVMLKDSIESAVASTEKMLPAVVSVNTQLAVMRDNLVNSIGGFVVEGDKAVQKAYEIASAMERWTNHKFDGMAMSDLTAVISTLEEQIRNVEQDIREAVSAGTFDSTSVTEYAEQLRYLQDKADAASAALWDLQTVRGRISDATATQYDTKEIAQFIGTADETSKKINEILEKIREYKQVISSMEKSKIPFDDASYKAAVRGLNEAQNAFNEYKASISSAPKFAVPDLSGITTPIKGIAKIIGKELSLGFGLFKSFGSRVKGVLNDLSKFWARTMRTLKFMIVRKAFTALIKDIGAASKSLAQFDGYLGQKFNASMSSIISNLRWFGANLVAAFSPIVNAVAPIIDWLISKLEAAIAVINQFFSALSGEAIFVRAKKNIQDYGAAVGGAGKQAKKLKDYLLGIDELNVLKPDEDTGGGGGGGASGYPYEWVEQDIAKNIKDLADKIKALFKNGDFYRLGQMLAEILADALWNIDWLKIQKAVERIATNIADFINGFFSVDKLWKGIGHTIAQGLNTALIFVDTLLRKIDWGQIGRQIGNLINQAVKEFDWMLLGQTLADAINAAFEFFYNAGITIDFVKIGKGISSSINKFFSTLDIEVAAGAINTWTKGLFDALITAIEKIKWNKIGKKIGDFLASIDWLGIMGRIAKLIWTALTSALSAAAGMFSAAPIESSLLAVFGGISFLNSGLFKNISKGFSSLSGSLRKIGKLFGGAFDSFNTTLSHGGGLLKSYSAGVSNLSQNLTGAQKAMIGITAGLAGFGVISNTFHDLTDGSKKWYEALLPLLIVIPAIGTALSVAFGSTTIGWIVTGLVAVGGAIYGIVTAHSEMVEAMAQNAFEGMIANTEGAGHTLDDFKIRMQDTATSVTSKIQEFKDGFGRLNDYIRPSVETAMTTISGIATAVATTRTATEDELKMLGEAFDSLKEMSIQYVQQMYDNLIAVDLAQLQYVQNTKGYESEEAQAIAERISNLWLWRDEAVEAVGAATDTLEENIMKEIEIMKDASLSDEEYAASKRRIVDSIMDYGGAVGEYGVKIGDMEKYSKIASDAVGQLSGALDLSGANVSNAEEVLGKFNDVIVSNTDTYNNAISDLKIAKENYIAEAIAINKFPEEEARQMADNVFDPLFTELDTAFSENMATLQVDALELFPQFADALAQSDLDASQIKAKLNTFAEELFGGDDGLSKMLKDATKNVEMPTEILSESQVKGAVDSMFSTVTSYTESAGVVYAEQTMTTMAQNYSSAFNSAITPAFQEFDFGGTFETAIGNSMNQLDLSSYVDTMQGKTKPLGEASMEGIVTGAEEALPLFDPMAQNAAEHLDQALRGSFDAHSPAGLTIPHGEMIVEGIAEGMKATEPLTTAAKTIASSVDSSLSSAFSNVGKNISLNGLGAKLVAGISMEVTTNMPAVKTSISTGLKNAITATAATIQWTPLFSNIITTFQTAWENVTSWWRGAVASWFNNDVTPYFVTQKWLTTSRGMREGLLQTWREFTVQWNSALTSWWTSSVAPWFSQSRWQSLGSSMRAGIMQGFRSIVNEFAQVMNAVIDVFNQALRNIANGVNGTIQSFNNVMSSQGMSGMPSVNAGTIGRVSIPSFRAGGFPEDGLFMANSSELIGTFDNGKTAVVNNEQIQAGIRESMREALIDTLGAYLSRIADSTERTADKDYRIFLDTREVSAELDRRRSKSGFSFAG